MARSQDVGKDRLIRKTKEGSDRRKKPLRLNKGDWDCKQVGQKGRKAGMKSK